MKLTTKLLLTAGLTFVLGAPAFATATTAVTIVNVDCPSTFRIYANGYNNGNPFDSNHKNVDVPPGPNGVSTNVPSGGLSTIASTTDIIAARRIVLEPGATITAKFKMYEAKIGGVVLGKICGYAG